MLLLDTSEIYAWGDRRDPNHPLAHRLLQLAADNGETLLVHSYVIVEAVALLQRRLGLGAALAFLSDLDRFQTHWITPAEHTEAADLLRLRQLRDLSLVDCASFVIMRRLGISQALAFDAHFQREGFALYTGQA